MPCCSTAGVGGLKDVVGRPVKPVLATEDQVGQFVRRAEHRLMAGIEFVPAWAELFGAAALVRLAGVGRLSAPDHGRVPPRTVPRTNRARLAG